MINDLLRQYWKHREFSELDIQHLMDLFVEVCDADAITPKLQGHDLKSASEVRTVFDPDSIQVKQLKGTDHAGMSFLPGVTALVGPNNSGKSTLLDAMRVALTGCRDASIIMRGKKHMMVDLQAAQLTVSRCVKAGKTLKTELTVRAGGSEDDTPAKAQALLESYLGIDVWTLIGMCLVDQGQMADILDERPGFRREAFYELLKLDGAETTRLAFAEHLRKIETVDTKQYEEDVARFATRWTGKDRAVLDELVTQLRAKAQGVDTVAIERMRTTVATMESTVQARAAYQRDIDGLQQNECLKQPDADPQESARDVAAAESKLKSVETELTDLTKRKADTGKRGAALRDLPPTCETCALVGKTCELTTEFKEDRLNQLRREWIELDEKETGLHKAAVTGRELVYRLHEILAHVNALAHQQTRARERVADAHAAMAKLPNVDLAALASLKDQIAACDGRNKDTVAAQLELQSAASRLQSYDLDALVAKKAQAKLDALKAGGSQERIVRLKELIFTFSKAGAPLWLARQHLTRVNEIAAEILGAPDWQFDDDLGIVCGDVASDHAGGAARQRGALALRVAQSLYLQELRGLRIPFLWIDELPFQDQGNVAAVGRMLQRLKARIPKIVFASSGVDMAHMPPECVDHVVTLGAVNTLKQAVDQKMKEVDAVVAKSMVSVVVESVTTEPDAVALEMKRLDEELSAAKGEIVRTTPF